MKNYKITLIAVLILLVNSKLQGQEITDTVLRKQKIDSLLKAVGGEEVWAKAKGFRMLEIAHYSKLKHPMVREFYVDFEKPRIKMQTKSIEKRELVALNLNTGWTKNEKEEIVKWKENQVNGWKSFWPGIPTRIFSMLAKKHHSVSYKVYPDRIDFYIDNIFAVWVATAKNGIPVAYGREKEHVETHFLGEVMAYGPVNLWRDAYEPGGQWQFTMVDYELLTDLSHVSFEPPKEQ